jgi:hypothetical protein
MVIGNSLFAEKFFKKIYRSVGAALPFMDVDQMTRKQRCRYGHGQQGPAMASSDFFMRIAAVKTK